ncbi:hypothetical protein [Flavobacterium sp. AJR]|uniref:hypothetical protein n=1 Tax=Flavobacterium sp. AJR TaxID=1979369 RepID=UPI000A3D6F32|nr:hypothetical protein [Flavobacterium sp. AJR]OUL59986.1 hypothetical protein B8T70_22715 [Flavobacterium sp. AJR]
MDALTAKEKNVLATALRILFDKKESNYETCSTISDLAIKLQTKNAEEIKNDLLFVTQNPF